MKIDKREKNCFHKGENNGWGGCSKRNDELWDGHGPGQALATGGRQKPARWEHSAAKWPGGDRRDPQALAHAGLREPWESFGFYSRNWNPLKGFSRE